MSAAHTKMEITNETRTSEWKCMVHIVWNGGKNLMDYKFMEKKWQKVGFWKELWNGRLLYVESHCNSCWYCSLNVLQSANTAIHPTNNTICNILLYTSIHLYIILTQDYRNNDTQKQWNRKLMEISWKRLTNGC